MASCGRRRTLGQVFRDVMTAVLPLDLYIANSKIFDNLILCKKPFCNRGIIRQLIVVEYREKVSSFPPNLALVLRLDVLTRIVQVYIVIVLMTNCRIQCTPNRTGRLNQEVLLLVLLFSKAIEFGQALRISGLRFQIKPFRSLRKSRLPSELRSGRQRGSRKPSIMGGHISPDTLKTERLRTSSAHFA
jgi:hypothetical protein